jgi:alkylation response protein AidB-like acyl-CoA dehydrogenase
MNFAPTDEQKMVREMVRKFAETHIKPIAAELDRTHHIPRRSAASWARWDSWGSPCRRNTTAPGWTT